MFISSLPAISLTFVPPMFISPSLTSQNLAIRLASVVLPPPDGPTSAICSPDLIFILISVNALLLASSYLKETLCTDTE